MKQAPVAVFMGSESDLPVMSKASELLSAYGVEHSVTVASAHRSPEFLRKRVSECEDEGVRVFIAGAGGAAHLAGVLASMTLKPVIGVPLTSKLSGLDSLLSTVQMPRGVPVATVAVDGAENAALLAVEILALGAPRLAKRLAADRERKAAEIASKGRKR